MHISTVSILQILFLDKLFFLNFYQYHPYLKGFHLSLETWQEGQDSDGWKVGGTLEKNKDQVVQGKPQASENEEESQEAFENQEVAGSMDEFKLRNLIGSSTSNTLSRSGPPSGVTVAVPRFQQDLKALLLLAQSERPILRCMQSNKCGLTAFYGFGDASSSGFGLLVQRPDELFTRFGIWPCNVESESSNYRELRNLVEAMEEEAKVGFLADSEFWLFTDNLMAESCFYKGGLSSKTLHELVLRLKRAELEAEFMLFIVHVAGMHMIVQGTDGLSRGIILEGVMLSKNMLHFVLWHRVPERGNQF
jgi:hypothetical protein